MEIKVYNAKFERFFSIVLNCTCKQRAIFTTASSTAGKTLFINQEFLHYLTWIVNDPSTTLSYIKGVSKSLKQECVCIPFSLWTKAPWGDSGIPFQIVIGLG